MNNIIHLQNKNGIWYEITYEIIRSRRRTYSIGLNENGTLTVRVPFSLGDKEVEYLLHEKQSWITGKLAEQKLRQKNFSAQHYPVEEQAAMEKRYREAAGHYIPERVSWYITNYGDIIGDNCLRITIRNQKTRWGSCSSKKTLSFNWRLMLAPPSILDYVVVHELCHLRHMNHSAEFWHCVEQILPDYKIRRKWLKDHGNELTLS